MSEYTLNDIKFTPGSVEELPVDAFKDTKWNLEELNKRSEKTWKKFEQYERDFEERIKQKEKMPMRGC